DQLRIPDRVATRNVSQRHLDADEHARNYDRVLELNRIDFELYSYARELRHGIERSDPAGVID
ncbi:MAG TPA: hypothetical protein VMM60_15320, partial [Ilumatobacter sp.]|nr:hypothetical protein [Ilumatobacter sp.]